MALFDDASLVTTPNGYKAGTLYSIKPTSGAGDMTVVRATTATRVNSAGLIESVAINVPRLDYTDSTCPSLLVEPQRTNLLKYSEQFDNANWQKLNGGIGLIPTVTANTATAPDGTLTADRIQLSLNGGTSGSDISYINTSVSTTAATFSIYAKSNTTPCTIYFRNGSTVTTINITTEWQRFELYSSGAITVAQFGLRGGSYGGAVNSNTADISVWGGQLEVGSYPTSYIPTTSAAVTRNADVISKTGISSLIGQTEGTILIDFILKNPISATNRMFSLTESNWNIGGSIYINAVSNKFNVDIVNAGASAASINYSFIPQQNTRYKIAVAYKENDCKMYVNGVDAGSDTTTSAMPTCSELYLNALGGGFNAPYEATAFNVAALFPTRLTNAELASLTTI
jgi:hypothetical protein